MHIKFFLIMRSIFLGALVLACGFCVSSCGGANDAPAVSDSAKPNIAFRVQHFLYQGPQGASMNLLVRSVEPRFDLATKGVARVDFLLFGHDMQTLTQPSEAALALPALRYYFDMPADFTKQNYACDTGDQLSEVRVTDTAGQVLSQTFELCPGEPAEFPPVFSNP